MTKKDIIKNDDGDSFFYDFYNYTKKILKIKIQTDA